MVILIRLSIHKKDLENQLMGLSFRGCVHSIVCSYCYQEQLFFDRYKWLIAKKKAIARKAEARYKKKPMDTDGNLPQKCPVPLEFC